MEKKKCFLRPIDATHESISLLDNTPITIGRGPLTKIRDSRCSRLQVLLVADFSNNIVKVTQVGRNSCGIDGVETKKDKTVELKHGQKLDILFSQYSYIVEFDPAPGKKLLHTPVNEVSDSEDEVSPPPAKIAKVISPRQPDEISAECWEATQDDLLIYKAPGVVNRGLIAGYDLDFTIISTRSGKTFPADMNDWKIMYPEVLKKLEWTFNNDYKIVIFTNQASLNCSLHIKNFQLKIERIVAKLNVPVEVYIARGSSMRKPMMGMWNAMIDRNGNVKVDKQTSYYCGDAAGRVAAAGMKPDFSQADILFARNIGVTFYTPEEHFLLKKDQRQIKITAFNPKMLPDDIPLCDPEDKQILAIRQELVLMVGSPGSGKSHFTLTHMVPGGYKRVNRDELGSVERCLQAVQTHLMNGCHVVVDNTNPTISSRAKFLSLALKQKIPVRAFVMNTCKEHAKHNIKFRDLTDKSHAPVADVIVNTFFKNYEQPRMDEGYSEIVRINFWPVFASSEQESLYKMFLTEK